MEENRSTSEHVLRLSGYYNCLNQVGVYLPDKIAINKVCKLQQSIYGLVQASRSLNIHFDEMIKACGFLQTYSEACIYEKVSGSTTTFLISICE